MQITTQTGHIPERVLMEEHIPYRTCRKQISAKLRNADISYFCMCTWPRQILKGIWMSCLFMSRLACEQAPGKSSPTPTPRSLRCPNSSVSRSPNFLPRPLRDPDRRRFVPSSSCFPGVPENKGCCHISLSPDVMWIFYAHSGLPCYTTNSVAQLLLLRSCLQLQNSMRNHGGCLFQLKVMFLWPSTSLDSR